MSTQAPEPQAENAFETVYHRYEPHRGGLPDVRVYLKELWRRREFAFESSKAGMRGANSMTFFGQAWLVINPLLLALVYFFMVNVLKGESSLARLAHITGGIFVFYFFQGAVATGANSVTGAGKLLLNTAFPRLLLPLAAVRTGFFRFLPTIPVYFVIHALAGNPWSWATFLVAPVFLLMLAVFAAGLAALFATLQVYFRDTQSFLPYVMRIWLYTSPVILTVHEIAANRFMGPVAFLNPLFSLIGGYNEALQYGTVPSLSIWLQALAWSLVAAVAGSVFFMTRERDFAVRI